MTAPWEIRLPPPISPVQPSNRIQERTPRPKRQRRRPEDDAERHQDRKDDDDPTHIDDYA